jgi:serine/threonine-protein kinase RsbW
VRFAIGSRLTEVRRAVDLASAFCARNALAERDSNAIAVALDEVLSNVIHHGLGDAVGHEISIFLSYANGEISLEIEDDSAPFDPTQVPAPEFASNLAQRKVGGLGLMFVRALTDSVAYRRTSDRNCLVLRRRVSGIQPAPQAHAEYPRYQVSDFAQGVGRVVAVAGRLDSETAKSFRDQLLQLIRGGAARLAIDLTRVSYVGSAGIWVLLAADDPRSGAGWWSTD